MEVSIKKFWSFLLSFALSFSVLCPAFAVKAQTNDMVQVECNGYAFELTETVNSLNQTVRTFERPQGTSPQSDVDHAETKALLLSLGADQTLIDNLTKEDLDEYSTSYQLVGVTTYTKTDADGNTVNLDEDVALRESSLVRANQEQTRSSGDTSVTTEDSYMRIYYLISYKGGGEYWFSSNARWLTMPNMRFTDSLGSCAQNCTVVNNTRSGYYTYDEKATAYGSVTNKTHREDITTFKNAVNGSWYGSIGIFSLPKDIINSTSSFRYSNFFAHYEYRGHVNYPNEAMYFCTTSSYTHATIGVSVVPSAVIQFPKPKATAAIGIDVKGSVDIRTAEPETDIYYTP